MRRSAWESSECMGSGRQRLVVLSSLQRLAPLSRAHGAINVRADVVADPTQVPIYHRGLDSVGVLAVGGAMVERSRYQPGIRIRGILRGDVALRRMMHPEE